MSTAEPTEQIPPDAVELDDGMNETDESGEWRTNRIVDTRSLQEDGPDA